MKRLIDFTRHGGYEGRKDRYIMITKEEAIAYLDRMVEAYKLLTTPLVYGDKPLDNVRVYEPFYDRRLPIHDLSVVVTTAELPVRRVFSPIPDADEIILEYKGVKFCDYVYPKCIGKKVTS